MLIDGQGMKGPEHRKIYADMLRQFPEVVTVQISEYEREPVHDSTGFQIIGPRVVEVLVVVNEPKSEELYQRFACAEELFFEEHGSGDINLVTYHFGTVAWSKDCEVASV